MCADIHDGREQTLPSKGRIQMSQTNYLQIVKSGLQRTAVGPFDQLAGSWSGSGTIDLSHGRQEPIKCRASYGVLEEGEELETNLLQCKPGQSSVAQRTRALGWGFQCTRSRCNRPRQVKDQFPVGIPTNALCNLVTACASCSRCKISSFGM
jgi:hypothetical protein